MRKAMIIFKRNRGICIGILMLLFCYFCQSIDIWKSYNNEPVIDYKPSALVYSIEAIYFGGVILVFPLCACFPGYYRLIENTKCTIQIDNVNNISSKKQLIRSFITSGFTVSFPFVVHTIIWNIVAIPINPDLYESHKLVIYGMFQSLYGEIYGLPLYLFYASSMFFCGGVIAVVHLSLSIWIKDPTTCLIFPSVIYFIWIKIGTLLNNYIPLPADLFNDALTIDKALTTFAVYLSILILCSLVYLRKGGYQNEKA